jgi:hypothetical protein
MYKGHKTGQEMTSVGKSTVSLYYLFARVSDMGQDVFIFIFIFLLN